jgi:hypothetical protein
MCVLSHLHAYRSSSEELSPERKHRWIGAVGWMFVPALVIASVVGSLLRMA